MFSGDRMPGNEQIRVLIVNRKALPSIGGKQIYTDRLATGLVQEGAKVRVLATAESRPLDIPDVSCPIAYRPDLNEIWRCVKEASVVHFNAFSWKAWLFATLLRKPTVFVYHEAGDRLCTRAAGWCFWQRCCDFQPSYSCTWCKDIPFARSPRHWITKPIQQRIIDRMDAVVSPSRWILDRFPKRTHWIPHGINISEFCPAENPTRDYLLFLGRLVADKGPDLLIRAVAECQTRGQTIRLVLVGDGPLRQDLESLAGKLGIKDQVRFMGGIPSENTVPYYQNALALVVPSIWVEMFGLVALEAMACRTPVIASSIGGLKDTAGRGGLVYPPGDVSALVNHILRLSGDPDFAAELSGKGYRLVMEHYQESRMVCDYLRLYRELEKPSNIKTMSTPGDERDLTEGRK